MMVKMHFFCGVELYIVGLDKHLMTDRSPSVIITPKIPPLTFVLPSILLIITHLNSFLRRQVLHNI